MNDKISVWKKADAEERMPSQLRMFPTEYLLRAIFSKDYFEGRKEYGPGKKVLDIGSLYINNLIPFADRGCDLYAVEINEDMVNLAKESAQTWNVNVEVRQGTNRELPFEDNFFDALLSIHTIHYENNREELIAGLKEFKRVVKDKGELYIATASPVHHFFQSAKRVDENQYRLNVEDFRDGQIMSYFDSKQHFFDTLKKVYKEVQVCTISEYWPKNPLGFYLAKCINTY